MTRSPYSSGMSFRLPGCSSCGVIARCSLELLFDFPHRAPAFCWWLLIRCLLPVSNFLFRLRSLSVFIALTARISTRPESPLFISIFCDLFDTFLINLRILTSSDFNIFYTLTRTFPQIHISVTAVRQLLIRRLKVYHKRKVLLVAIQSLMWRRDVRITQTDWTQLTHARREHWEQLTLLTQTSYQRFSVLYRVLEWFHISMTHIAVWHVRFHCFIARFWLAQWNSYEFLWILNTESERSILLFGSFRNQLLLSLSLACLFPLHVPLYFQLYKPPIEFCRALCRYLIVQINVMRNSSISSKRFYCIYFLSRICHVRA